jgi:molybdopterin-guanine dinucleotide biosynthesis protein A
MADVAAVVLAGGRSSRMGTPKAALEWHGSTLLRRTTGLLQRAVDGPVVVARAPGQELPALPADVEVADDPQEGLGPLQGLATGLAAVGDRADVAFVCATDLPFLHLAFVRLVLSALDGGADVALPVAGGYEQPFAAAYRVQLAPLVAELVAADRLKPAFLFAECAVERIDEAALRADPLMAAVDPGLESVVNLNTEEEYKVARRRPAPEVTVVRHWPARTRAATLGAASSAAGRPLDPRVAPKLNGRRVKADPQLPLVRGDVVAFPPA